MRAGKGIHVAYVPGTFIPAANRRNDYLMDRAAQKAGLTSSGVAGIAMQDASLQESMGVIQDRTVENLCSTDNGVIMTRKELMQAAKANQDGQPVKGLDPAQQKVRSVAIELPRDENFVDGARHGLFAELGTDPVTV